MPAHLKIVHLSETDRGGGAGICAYRLHRSLIDAGADSVFLVSRKLSQDSSVKELFGGKLATLRRLFREHRDQLPFLPYPRRHADFSSAFFASGIWRQVLRENPSVTHLHWVNKGFAGLSDLRKLRAPLVWTLHDYWPLTGGCHYFDQCRGFEKACGRCPRLGSGLQSDPSRLLFRKKLGLLGKQRPTLTTYSTQSVEIIQRSSLGQRCPMRLLPIGVNTALYRPQERRVAREILGLPQEARIALNPSLSPDWHRKGCDLLEKSLAALPRAVASQQLLLLTLGEPPREQPPGAVPTRHLGRLLDDVSLSLAYSAADLTLVPSREETGPNTTLESLACGTPVLGYAIGLNRDLLDGSNGYAVPCFDTQAFAARLIELLAAPASPALRERCRESVLPNHDSARQATRFLELYRELAGLAP